MNDIRALGAPAVNQQLVPIQRAISSPEEATPFGCCNFFDMCADGVFSLYYKPQSLKLLDWMGFNVTDVCLRSVDFINYVRPEQSQGSDTGGYIGDPCAAPNGVEFGSCSLSVEDFGLYGRQSFERTLWKPKKYCKASPRFMLDNSPITSELIWDMTFVMDQMLNDIRQGLITGNANVDGQFDGLQRWVKTGYDCSSLDSYVLDWNNNPMSGGAGITLNGAATTPSYNLIDFLLDLHRNNNERIGWSPLLGNQSRREGDSILVMPGFMIRCLLDFFTCWSVCPETIVVGNDLAAIATKDVRESNEFRLTLNGGMFGDGKISLDGETIHILQYDWGLINGPTRGDMYYLTGALGNQRIWEGEHLSAQVVINELMSVGNDTHGFYTQDGGRVLGKTIVGDDGLCRTGKLWMAPRLWCMAPWLQIRILDVACHRPTGPLSPDPSDTSFYPEDSMHQAHC